MKLGEVSLDFINDGTFKLDGGQMFGAVPRALWEKKVPPDAQNRVTMHINCLLLRTAGRNILVETGIGTKNPPKRQEIYGIAGGKLVPGLKAFGLKPEDIDTVVLTHLHFDHAGGCTYLNGPGKPVPTFPRARHLVQRLNWEEAVSDNERTRRSYAPEDFLPLQEAGLIDLLDGQHMVAPGVWVDPVGGHANGLQAVHVTSGNQRAVFLGDVLPTVHHLALPWLTGFDVRPLETMEAKRKVLAEAERDGWLLLFSHGSPGEAAGFVDRRNGQLVLRPIAL